MVDVVLTLNATVGVAAGECLDLGHGDEVEVAGYGLLEGGGCHGKLEGLTLGGHGEQAVDDTARERVAATHAVNDGVDVVAF